MDINEVSVWIEFANIYFQQHAEMSSLYFPQITGTCLSKECIQLHRDA